ncbi:Flp pilus assembly protein TadG [Solimonas aquatica]|uniref:Flp pilus assembly protein TadG n=1 Tax=Solimonas aquatica TaxID=489703 RepID=A0A1H9HY79_9GAMM|nr:vWA domain-containing protein [Solimonas aquatica]SEQ67291.1 Flp pilus assembly protein TadG [Solimonas aquatica]
MRHAYPRSIHQKGAALILFVTGLMAMTLMLGLALDGGLLYMARAALSKGVDAAALMGARQLSLGDTTAGSMARSAFDINYAASNLPSRQVSAPSVNISFSTDASGIRRITVNASVRLNTYLIGVLPEFSTVTVASSAQALRAKLVMGLVLDRSGSMSSNGGSSALGPAVQSFVSFFDDSMDRVAMSSFSDAATLNVSLRYNFKTTVTNAAKSLSYSGWTYTHGGLDIARTQVNTVASDPNNNVLHVVVLFTDGYANSFYQANTRCTRSGSFGNYTYNSRNLILVPGSSSSDFRDPATGASVSCPYALSTFYSYKYAANKTRNSTYITEEGGYQAENSAKLIRQDGTLVYAIGLGTDIDKTSLKKIANDRSSSTFNAAQPEGLAVFAPTASDLDLVFKQIASRILLRLTQ